MNNKPKRFKYPNFAGKDTTGKDTPGDALRMDILRTENLALRTQLCAIEGWLAVYHPDVLEHFQDEFST
jgi:hypothetical protein